MFAIFFNLKQIVFSSFLNLHHLNIQLAMLCVKDSGQEVKYDSK